MLDDGVKNAVLHGQTDLASIGANVFEVLLVDLFSSLLQYNNAAVVEAPNVPARDAEIDLTNLNIASFFGICYGVMHAPLCSFEIDDLTFANPARRCATHP